MKGSRGLQMAAPAWDSRVDDDHDVGLAELPSKVARTSARSWLRQDPWLVNIIPFLVLTDLQKRLSFRVSMCAN